MIIATVVLLAAALGFVAAELFVPSHGVLALLAGMCALGAVVAASFVGAIWGVLVGVGVVVAAPVVFFWAARLYPQTPMGRRVLLAPPPPGTAEGPAPGWPVVGDMGVAMSVLRPAGSVEIEGQRVICVSEAEVIPAGTTVQVIKVQGTRVVVKAVA